MNFHSPAYPRPEYLVRCARLAEKGLTPEEIASMLGIQRDGVLNYMRRARKAGITDYKFPVRFYNLCRKRGRRGILRPDEREKYKINIVVDREVLVYLYEQAAPRDMTISTIIQAALYAIADDDMLGAVLDDGVEA